MKSSALLLAGWVLTACRPEPSPARPAADHAPMRDAAPSAPAPPPAAGALPTASVPTDPADGVVVEDDVAILVPGGGNGWAGCALHGGTTPPEGSHCIEGTHWDHCDCVCNRRGASFDEKTRTCR